ncbi:high mobility group 20 B (predicted), isoform CRA_c [Rattus norvegicus]|uniref:High mobility group 20 B (Predicted), isoform CRA_c n=1 Tax=Rattus norvegicus TaxID=10116 RepID=A6K891_RAT|nr:high mobility group 20 B (predicted), isoform CRA_c [Rattus norvegicus]
MKSQLHPFNLEPQPRLQSPEDLPASQGGSQYSGSGTEEPWPPDSDTPPPPLMKSRTLGHSPYSHWTHWAGANQAAPG